MGNRTNGKATGLPPGWVWTTVGELYHIIGGGTPSTEVPEYWTGTVPWITSADIHGLQDIRPRKHITEQAIQNSAASLIPAGSLIVVTRVALGKVALARFPVCFSQDSQGLIGDSDVVDPHYSCLYLSQAVQSFKYVSRGTTISGVTKKQLKELPFVLPPLPEQRRIVAEIEKQFTRLDAGVAALKRVQANLKRYRASVLKAACEGRLAPQDPNDEPADRLLARILAERRAKWEAEHPAKKYVEPAAPVTDGLPELPAGWCHTLLTPLLSVERAGMKTGPFGSLLKKHEHRVEGVPVVGIENIAKMRFVPGSRVFVTPEKATQLSEYELLPGDVVISRSGTVGEVCIIPDGLGQARMSTNVMRIVLVQRGMLPDFFSMLFNGSPFVLSQISELCSGSTRDFLNQTILSSMVFPLPPLPEQYRIVAEVERRLSMVAALEAAVAANLARAGRLRQAVLKRAFEGRLVGQLEHQLPRLLWEIK